MTDPHPLDGMDPNAAETDPFAMGDADAGGASDLDPFSFDSGDDLADLVHRDDHADILEGDGVSEEELTALLGDDLGGTPDLEPSSAPTTNRKPDGPVILRPFRAPDRPPPEVKRFVFDSNFGDRPPPPPAVTMVEPELDEIEPEPEPIPEPEPEPPPPPPPTFSEEELAAAKAAAYADGEHAGRAQAERSVESRLASTMEMVAHAIPGALSDRQRIMEAFASDSARLAHAIVAKLFPALSNRYGLDEIEAVIADGVSRALDEPRLLIRVSPHNAGALADRVQEMAKHAGFEGRVSIVSEDSLGPADVRVEWGDGGAERMTQRAWNEVTAIVDRAVAGMSGGRHAVGEHDQSAPSADHRSGAAMGSAA